MYLGPQEQSLFFFNEPQNIILRQDPMVCPELEMVLLMTMMMMVVVMMVVMVVWWLRFGQLFHGGGKCYYILCKPSMKP